MSSQKSAEDIKKSFVESLTALLDDHLNEPLEELYKQINESETEIDELLDPSWKSGLSKLQVDRYTKKILNILNYDVNEIPTVPYIVDNQELSIEDKGKAINLYDTLQMHPKFTPEYDFVKKKLIDLVNNNLNYNLTPEQQKIADYFQEKEKNPETQLTLREKLYKSNQTMQNMELIHELIQKLDIIPSNDSDYAGVKEIIDIALSIPTNSIPPVIKASDTPQKINNFLKKLQKSFDEEIYGLKDVKIRILELLTNKLTSPNGSVITFAGSAGTGKTLFVKIISKVLELPMEIIPLAGISDTNYLNGFMSTYTKSTHGRIVGALRKMKCKNGIILYEEVDKIDPAHHSAISGTLILVFDPEQNNQFKDKFLGDITVDLSQLLQFITVNDLNNVNYIARDRMEVINFRPLTLKEKVGAIQLRIIPETLNNLGFQPQEVIFSDDNIKYFINKSKNADSEGLRCHKRNMQKFMSRINLLKKINTSTNPIELPYSIPNLKFPLKMTKDIIDRLFNEDVEDDIFKKGMYI